MGPNGPGVDNQDHYYAKLLLCKQAGIVMGQAQLTACPITSCFRAAGSPVPFRGRKCASFTPRRAYQGSFSIAFSCLSSIDQWV